MRSPRKVRAAITAVLAAPVLALSLAAAPQAGAVIYYPWQGTYARVNVYGRTSPSSTASHVYLYQGGQVVYYTCWTTGESVNGDNIWYLTRPNPSLPQYQGYVAGWWIETGADPNGKVGHC
jgi:hypothetical protein